MLARVSVSACSFENHSHDYERPARDRYPNLYTARVSASRQTSPLVSGEGQRYGIAGYQSKDGAKELPHDEGGRASCSGLDLVNTYITSDLPQSSSFLSRFFIDLLSLGTARGKPTAILKPRPLFLLVNRQFRSKLTAVHCRAHRSHGWRGANNLNATSLLLTQVIS